MDMCVVQEFIVIFIKRCLFKFDFKIRLLSLKCLLEFYNEQVCNLSVKDLK